VVVFALGLVLVLVLVFDFCSGVGFGDGFSIVGVLCRFWSWFLLELALVLDFVDHMRSLICIRRELTMTSRSKLLVIAFFLSS
jgi:hypothetical protein